MAWLKELVDWTAADLALALVVGQSITGGRSSDDADLPDRAVILTEFVGSVLEHFGTANDLERPNLQAFVRSKREADDALAWVHGRALAWRIQRKYAAVTGALTPGGTELERIQPLGTPSPLGRDSFGRHSWTVDFRVFLPANAPLDSLS